MESCVFTAYRFQQWSWQEPSFVINSYLASTDENKETRSNMCIRKQSIDTEAATALQESLGAGWNFKLIVRDLAATWQIDVTASYTFWAVFAFTIKDELSMCVSEYAFFQINKSCDGFFPKCVAEWGADLFFI